MSEEMEELFSKASSFKKVGNCINELSKNNKAIDVRAFSYKFMLPVKEKMKKRSEGFHIVMNIDIFMTIPIKMKLTMHQI